MNTEEVASKLVALCREQKWLEAINSLYGDDIVSVEAREIGEMPAEMRGLDQVRGKTQWFIETSQIPWLHDRRGALLAKAFGVCRPR